ncbi:MAG: ABC transporter permease [Anaerolineae bacterium]|nr:ABC transporter permease [Gemmatimonadaceae bacterium]
MTTSLVPGVRVVRVAGWLVPESHRCEWTAEWMGELEHSWRAQQRTGNTGSLARAALVLRCFGAFSDALWLRRRHGEDAMFSNDLTYAVRTLLRRPGFSMIVILTLALGIGANTAIFSVVNAVLLRNLPYEDPDRLMMLWGVPTDGDSAKVARWTSYPDFIDLRNQSVSFDQLAAAGIPDVTLTGPNLEPTRIQGAVVTANLFPTLGVRPAKGRAMLPEEEREAAPRVAVVSHALWQGRLAADPNVVGRVITLDGVQHTVIGVMQRGFQYPNDAQLWIPLVPDRNAQRRGTHNLRVVGRLKPGMTRERAESDVATIARRLEEQYPEDNAKRSARLEPMRDAIVGNVRTPLLVLLGAVGLVLLIGCTNIANLFLARAATREREVAVRTALGAGRGQIVRQWMTESVLLALVGGACGLLVAHWGLQALMAAAPDTIPRAGEVALDKTVLAFVVSISLLTGIAFGVIPALGMSRNLTINSLKDGGRGATAGLARTRLRKVLVVSEVAFALVLVIGAALLIKSFWRLQQVDPGFDPERLLTVQLQLPQARYERWQHVTGFYSELKQKLASTPGARSVAIAFEHPLSEGWTSSFGIAGRQPSVQGLEPEARVRPVSPGYFRTVGVSLLKGRDITDRDVAGAPGVVIINDAFARRHFPGEDPIGKRIERGAWWPDMPNSFEIVGVVADERFLGLQTAADPATYFPHAQFPMSDMYLLVRTRADAAAFTAMVRREVWALDRDLPIENIRTMESILGESVAQPRFNTSLLGLFAGVALLLAAIGIYGVLSFMAAQRTNEIGIRMALGAQRSSVVRLVVGQGMLLALLGVALGLLAAFWLTRILSTLLFQVSTTDPGIFGGGALLLSTVALIAAYLPARRASRVDPVTALRYE